MLVFFLHNLKGHVEHMKYIYVFLRYLLCDIIVKFCRDSNQTFKTIPSSTAIQILTCDVTPGVTMDDICSNVSETRLRVIMIRTHRTYLATMKRALYHTCMKRIGCFDRSQDDSQYSRAKCEILSAMRYHNN